MMIQTSLNETELSKVKEKNIWSRRHKILFRVLSPATAERVVLATREIPAIAAKVDDALRDIVIAQMLLSRSIRTLKRLAKYWRVWQ